MVCGCVRVVWAGLGWAGLGWAGLGWTSLGWAGMAAWSRGSWFRSKYRHLGTYKAKMNRTSCSIGNPGEYSHPALKTLQGQRPVKNATYCEHDTQSTQVETSQDTKLPSTWSRIPRSNVNGHQCISNKKDLRPNQLHRQGILQFQEQWYTRPQQNYVPLHPNCTWELDQPAKRSDLCSGVRKL